MRVPLVVCLLALSLAGCSGNDDDGAPAVAAPSATSTSTAPPPPPLPTSDTMHFLAAPSMAAALPSDSSESTTPVTVGNFGQGGQGPDMQGAEWSHKVERGANVTAGEVHVWIVIKETLFEQPDNQVRPSCSWLLTVNLGEDIDPIQSCLHEPPGPVNPATKELTFPLGITSAIELEANETITVRLERSGFSLSANNAVDALSGSADHDSRVKLAGLREPIRIQS
jgi:hypothetical protein